VGTEHKDGVIERRVFVCSLCGRKFEVREHAKTCRRSHLHFSDIAIENAAVDDNAEYVFPEGQAFPAKIVVVGKGLDKQAIYVLDGYHNISRRPTMEVPDGKPKLRLSRPVDDGGGDDGGQAVEAP
jgi:UDP-N-acetyl-D-mannosaminuronic acid transferase (WecB/TagA/CpsF family)